MKSDLAKRIVSMTLAAALMLSMTFSVPFESWAAEENAGSGESVQTQDAEAADAEVDQVKVSADDQTADAEENEGTNEETTQDANGTETNAEPEEVRATELGLSTEGTDQGDPEQKVYPAPTRRVLGSFTASASRVTNSAGAYYNLREYLGEGIYGYSILQGSCIDDKGEYSYYCLRDTNDWGRLVKVRMSDGACVGVSNPYYFAHGNSMCYDSERNRVVVASYINTRQTIHLVDPNNLNSIEPVNLDMSELRPKLVGHGSAVGVTAIAYNAKYDCYITMQRADHNIVIYDAETRKAKAAAFTNFSGIGGTFQSIDADDTYVYFVMSEFGGKYGRNSLVAFDWHAENLQKLLNGDSTVDTWYCGSNGLCSAIITIPGAHEGEDLYHIETSNGRSHFYLANYNNDPTYKTVKVKKKWKKVWKKVKKKVKWKKVKKKVFKNGKWKKKKVWKYKYKKVKKKVWKYKYKKKTVFSHYNRDSHVLYLGEF